MATVRHAMPDLIIIHTDTGILINIGTLMTMKWPPRQSKVHTQQAHFHFSVLGFEFSLPMSGSISRLAKNGLGEGATDPSVGVEERKPTWPSQLMRWIATYRGLMPNHVRHDVVGHVIVQLRSLELDLSGIERPEPATPPPELG